MKTSLPLLFGSLMTAAALSFGGSVSAHAEEITYFDVDFNDYQPGPLTTSGTAFGVNNFASYTILENDEDGRYLRLSKAAGSSSTGTLTLYTSRAPSTPHQFKDGGSYVWSFDFRAVDTVSQTLLIRLDDGSPSAGHFITGMALTGTGVRYLTNPNVEAVGSQTTGVNADDFTLSKDTWYNFSFVVNTTERIDDEVSTFVFDYRLVITERGASTPAYEVSVGDLIPNAFNPNGNTRMIFSLLSGASNEVSFDVDNLRFMTIPEPGSVSLLVGGIAVGALLLRKRAKAR